MEHCTDNANIMITKTSWSTAESMTKIPIAKLEQCTAIWYLTYSKDSLPQRWHRSHHHTKPWLHIKYANRNRQVWGLWHQVYGLANATAKVSRTTKSHATCLSITLLIIRGDDKREAKLIRLWDEDMQLSNLCLTYTTTAFLGAHQLCRLKLRTRSTHQRIHHWDGITI